jgi:anion-transporting  ArsA/GET3 family ATPase
MKPRVYVCFGTGGVGKTTVSAALGTALARAGMRTLVVTCDPARRLADAFGVHGQPVPVPVDARQRLWCFMPEATASARQTVALLFGHDPARLETLQQNPVFTTLVDGLAGIHELGALAQLVELSASYDAIVVDTAPTRHALSLLHLPGQVGSLVDSRSLRWLANVSRRRLREPSAARPALARLLDWGESRLITELEASLGGAPVAACMELLIAGIDCRPELSRIAAAAHELLCSLATTYVLVAAPGNDTMRDVAYFQAQLDASAHPPAWLVLNHALDRMPAWPAQVATHPDASEPLRYAARIAAQELAARAKQSRDVRTELAARMPHVSVVTVPRLDATAPAAVVSEAANALTPLTSSARAMPVSHSA